MRGTKVETQGMFSYLSPEQRVPKDHPLRAIRVIVDRSLVALDSHFWQLNFSAPWLNVGMRMAEVVVGALVGLLGGFCCGALPYRRSEVPPYRLPLQGAAGTGRRGTGRRKSPLPRSEQ